MAYAIDPDSFYFGLLHASCPDDTNRRPCSEMLL